MGAYILFFWVLFVIAAFFIAGYAGIMLESYLNKRYWDKQLNEKTAEVKEFKEL